MIEALTVVVCAPLAVVLIVTDAAECMSTWWWLVVAGMLATWAGESVGNLAAHFSTVRAARTRHRRQRAHPGDRHLDWGDPHQTLGGPENAGGHTETPLWSDDGQKPGDPR